MTLDKHNICVCNIVTFATVQKWIYISFSLEFINFTVGVKGLLHLPKIHSFYIKNKEASPAQIEKVMQT